MQGEKSLWQRGWERRKISLCPLPAVFPSSCSPPAVPLPCKSGLGKESRDKEGLDQHKTLKCKNFSNRHCFGHKNCGGEKEIFVVLQCLTGAVRTGRVCSQLSTRFGAERNRNPKQEGNISYPAAAPRFLPPSPAPRSSFCYF